MARHGLLTPEQPGGAPSPGGVPAPATGGPAPAIQATTPAAPPVGEEQTNVSPEEQAQYDQFVDQALSAIYDEKSLPGVIESLKGNGNPVDGLANTAVSIVTRVQDSAEKAGQALSVDVLFMGGAEILEDLAGLSEKVGIHTFTPEEVEGALFQAMDLYREQKGRDGGGGQLAAQSKQDFSELVALDKAGELDKVQPGLTKQFGGGGAQGGAPT